MLPTISLTDFIGEISISTNRFTEVQFNSYVTQYKIEYIVKLLGAAAYLDMLNNDYDKWNFLLSGGAYDYVEDGIEKIGYFNGLNKCLLYLIYFHIVRSDFTMSETGAVINLNENATKVKHYSIAQDRYNKAITYLKEVYLYLDRVTKVEVPFTAVDNGGTFTITSDSFVVDGDVIVINGTEYTVFDRTLISFKITADSLSGTEYIYSPFSLVTKADLNYSYL